MCLCLFAINQHDEFPFILLANRDEFRKRPSAKAGFWEDHPTVLAGRDLQQMGTWLGVNMAGRIAFLTNYRDPKFFNRIGPSRGALVSDYLTNHADAKSYLKSIENPEEYNGFNLVTGTVNDLHYFSNVENEIRTIEAGVHGLSNAFLNSGWPKSDSGKASLSNAIQRNELESNNLFEILRGSEKPTDDKLPETGVGLELERTLSPLFINTQEYGTVCSTVIKIDRRNQVFFEERTFDNHGKQMDSVDFAFQVS